MIVSSSAIAMLLLFVVAAFADFAILPGASEAQATRRSNQHDDCIHMITSMAQYSAVVDSR